MRKFCKSEIGYIRHVPKAPMENSDYELKELIAYLEEPLCNLPTAAVPEYLNTFKFSSTLLRKWYETEQDGFMKQQFPVLVEGKGSLFY